MSLNRISGFPNQPPEQLHVKVRDIVIHNDFSLIMTPDVEPGEVMIVDIGGVAWVDADHINGASLAHLQAVIEVIDIESDVFETLQLEEDIVDPENQIILEADNCITLDHTGVFMCFVNYHISIPDNNQCYEARVVVKRAPNNDDPDVGFTEVISQNTTTVFNDYPDSTFLFSDGIYTFCSSFIVSTYETPIGSLTYLKIQIKKQNDEMDNTFISGGHIALFRLT